MAVKHIVLKGRSGAENVYRNVARISADTVDGGTAYFVLDDNAVETQAALSMADGDQVITPQQNGLESFKKVTVTKPDTLIPGNIKKNINIGGVVGTLESGGSSDRSALLDFGDASGDGCVIASPSYDELRVYTPASAFSWADIGYETLIASIAPTSTSVQTQLDAFAASLMTTHKSAFDAVFAGATKALFRDEDHVCDVPSFLDSDAHTFAGLRAALARTWADAAWHDSFSSSKFLDPVDCAEWYVGDGGGSFDAGDKARFRYQWFPVAADGEPVLSAYNLQDPSGVMPTYETGYAAYQGSSSAGCASINEIPAYGVTSKVFILAYGQYVVARSFGAQTLPEAFLQQLVPSWAYGNLTLPEGWSVTVVSAGSAATNSYTISAIQTMLNGMGGLPLDSMPFDTMDAYTKSYFLEITEQKYKKLNGKSFTIEFNIQGEGT